ncbi:hypothetical protein CONCODRAFT_74137 [Conidiobolus coronatus NRRL 28638]|uniref:Glycoside hydrolase family 18 protein n=1 Tax=Conidiobolus coronatus (strain ATCC 28846 / CBS 209.66 / NRRL 28638) TaxID=796925 RepID=A0A137NSR5_CONC2|nr:hypothetical protein CONCODRAFT_74137 [Conidiobolus coronatus NRRL 28638]|eukprot:KXN65740.1 hypothetical protein CONCODRAFT_74137 [Conidiobolus coronatus NRRL 28638]
MKLGLLGSSFLLCFEAVSALYPANVGQVQHLDYENHQFIRRSSDQKVKSFNVNYSCFGTQCKKVAAAINKLTNILSKIIQVKNHINIKVGYGSYCEQINECNIANMKILGYGGPLKYHIIKNKDGVDISYPIALYKQLVDPSKNDDFKSTTTPDIQLYFNSDDKYWFEGDGDIKDGQPDFYLVAARTLIRGLGVDFSIGRNGNYEFSSDPKLKNDTKLSTYETIFTPRYDASKDNSGLADLASTKFRRYILDTLMLT